MSRVVTRSVATLLLLLLVPTAARAQAAITGLVKDVSGGVLPGVTVEVASPVLIEKPGQSPPTPRASTESSTYGPAPTP
jgi:hypothetical protein